ncbi:hypothetical protein [Actinomyces sp.]
MFRRCGILDNNSRIFEPYSFRYNYSNAEGGDVFPAPNPFGNNDKSLAVTD